MAGWENSKQMENTSNISQFIESTLLKPETTFSQIETLCADSIKYNFHGICVNSMFIPFAKELLQGSKIKIVTVVGFPLGATMTVAKAKEAELAIQSGADEIDMVLAIGALKSGNTELVKNDIQSVVEASSGKPVKVIIETGLLIEREKILACELSLKGKAHFVKTCTGFSGGAANIDDILLMKKIVGNSIGIKASGGVKTFDQAHKLIEAGASRLGTSSGVDIILNKMGSNMGGY